MYQVTEILEKHNLDFIINKLPLVALNPDGSHTTSPYFGLVNSKTNEVINTCKEGYCVSQNEEVVKLALAGIKPFGDKLTVQKAGSLNGGRKVFIQLAIEGYSKVAEDLIKKYITIIDSNDGSTGLAVGIGDLTMSCQNQFMRFYKGSEAKFRHTNTLAQKMQTIPFLIENALNESLKLIEIYNTFASTPLTQNLADEMVKYILGVDRHFTSPMELAEVSTKTTNQMDKLYNHIVKETAQKGMNFWGLHSGITSFTTHEISAPKRENGRDESLLIGSGYNKNQSSIEFLAKKLDLVLA